LLLDAGANVNAPPAAHFGFTALQSAASNGKVEVVELLLANGAHINAPGAHVGGLTALQAAAFAGEHTLVELLLRQGADASAPASNEGGRTALQAAASCGHAMIVKILVKVGVDVNEPPANISGMTALQAALASGHDDVVTLLISYDALSDSLGSEGDGTSLLRSAIVTGKKDVLQKLYSEGVDMKQKDLVGQNCLHLISQHRHHEVMEWLLSQGLYGVNERDYNGMTPLYLAAENGLLANIRRLIDADANLDLEDNEGRTALLAAVQNNHPDAVRLLLEKGAGIEKLQVAHWRALLKPLEAEIVVVTEKKSGGRSAERHFMQENSTAYFERKLALLSERHL
jgi:ankyrin repeat protein